MICIYFLPIYEFSFHFVDGNLGSTKSCNLAEVKFICFLLLLLVLLVISKIPLPNPRLQNYTPRVTQF